MQSFSRLATAAAAITFVSLPATVVFAQNALTTGTQATTAPATAPAPAATTTAPAAAKPATTTTTTEQAAGPKKKKVRKMTRHKSVDSCPWSRGRYHKEYEHCVPFDKLW